MEYMKEKHRKEKRARETDGWNRFLIVIYTEGFPVVLTSYSMGFKKNARQFSASWILVTLSRDLGVAVLWWALISYLQLWRNRFWTYTLPRCWWLKELQLKALGNRLREVSFVLASNTRLQTRYSRMLSKCIPNELHPQHKEHRDPWRVSTRSQIS